LNITLGERRNLIVEINRQFGECQEILEQIELEIDHNTDPLKASRKTKLKSFYAELKRLEEEYNKSKAKPTLHGESSIDEDFEVLPEDQTQRLLGNSERLERTSKYLEEGYRICIETEDCAQEVLFNLSQQRDTLNRNRVRLGETNDFLRSSSRLINEILMRALRDKIILYIIVFTLLLSVFLAIYFSMN